MPGSGPLVLDGRTQGADPEAAHAIVYGGNHTPQDRALDALSRKALHSWQVLYVSNNPLGCRTGTHVLTVILDGLRIGTAHVEVVSVSEPIEDRDDPSVWRWTATISAQLLTSN
ncbi:MAG: hypothetical protein HZY73_11310 [Micropruina sp.]|nr:MAG: hypothetical protein HZY73_11310 [Micropruina sp.]